MGYDPEEKWQLGEARAGQPPELAAEPELQAVTIERLAKLVDGLSESVDARLETFARRLAAIEDEVRAQSASGTNRSEGNRTWSRERRERGQAPGQAPVDPQRAVDDALRALTASEPDGGASGD